MQYFFSSVYEFPPSWHGVARLVTETTDLIHKSVTIISNEHYIRWRRGNEVKDTISSLPTAASLREFFLFFSPSTMAMVNVHSPSIPVCLHTCGVKPHIWNDAMETAWLHCGPCCWQMQDCHVSAQQKLRFFSNNIDRFQIQVIQPMHCSSEMWREAIKEIEPKYKRLQSGSLFLYAAEAATYLTKKISIQ